MGIKKIRNFFTNIMLQFENAIYVQTTCNRPNPSRNSYMNLLNNVTVANLCNWKRRTFYKRSGN